MRPWLVRGLMALVASVAAAAVITGPVAALESGAATQGLIYDATVDVAVGSIVDSSGFVAPAEQLGGGVGVGSAGISTHAIDLSRSQVAPRVAGLADEGFTSPSSIRSSQNSVSPNFSAGGSIDDLATGLRNGSVKPGDVPPLRVFDSDGQWMTPDNRRLVAFQQAGVDVPYRLATPEEIAAETWKVTTTNRGASITIRGGGGTWP